MARLMELLHGRGAQSAHRIALDPVVDFPIDYRLLSDLVGALALDLARSFDPARPVAVRLDRGLALALLDLSLIAAGIPQLVLPSDVSANDAGATLAWGGAQACFSSGSGMVRLSHTIPILPLPAGTDRVVLRQRTSGNFGKVHVSLHELFATAESLVQSEKLRHFERHLALLSTSTASEAIAGFYGTILAGGTYVIPPAEHIGLAHGVQADFGRLVEAIAEMRITSLVVTPRLLAGLVAAMERRGCRLPTLMRVVVSEGPRPKALIERSRALGLPVRRGDNLAKPNLIPAFEESPGLVEGRPRPS